VEGERQSKLIREIDRNFLLVLDQTDARIRAVFVTLKLYSVRPVSFSQAILSAVPELPLAKNPRTN
jgi:hypothetical protein